MKVEKRHQELINILRKSDGPVSGSRLSELLNVSRQIIVSDINRLRENGYDIIPTPKGYILSRKDEVSRVFKVHHNADDTEKELFLLVDLGAYVKDVFIYHKVYGEIHAALNIRSRKDASEFCENIRSGKSSPLSSATAGYHYHTIITNDMETMILVEKALRENGFLAELTEYEPDAVSNY